MSGVRGLLALEAWSKKLTKGYKDVDIHNLTTSWRDGLAFCALIHHFRPDLIDFSSLSKENIHYNNSLAFSIAERELGIPSLLDPDDMVEHIEPDRRSIATYLAQFYDKFEVTKTKPSSCADCERIDQRVPSSNNICCIPKASPRKKHLCNVCGNIVNVTERIVMNGKSYHQNCYSKSQPVSESNLNCNDDSNESKESIQASNLNIDVNEEEFKPKEENINNVNTIMDDNKSEDAMNESNDNGAKRDDDKDDNKDKADHALDYHSQSNASSNLIESQPNNVAINQNDLNEINKKFESTHSIKDDSQSTVIIGDTSKVSSKENKSINMINQTIKNLSLSNTKPSILTIKPSITISNQSTKSSSPLNKDYPIDLNPFGDSDSECEDKETNGENYPTELNPFGDDEGEKEDGDYDHDSLGINTNSLENSIYSKCSTNDDYDDSLNPFGAEEDEIEEQETQLPKRKTPVPAPRRSLLNNSPLSSRSSYSTSSLERIKHQFKLEPNLAINSRHSASNLSFNSLTPAHTPSPRRSGKKGLAPKPPISNSNSSLLSGTSDTVSINSDTASYSPASTRKADNISNTSTPARSMTPDSDEILDKNTFGYWRKKKRQAPSIPIARRNILTVSLPEIQEECNIIGDKLASFESRSKQLESLISSKDLSKQRLKKGVIEFLQLAKEKCALIKRKEELGYMKSQHKLQEQQADIEYQIRVLDAKQLSLKTKEDEEKSSQLLQTYVDIIEKRNDIEEDIIKIDTRPDFEHLMTRLKELNDDKLIELLINDFVRKNFVENRVKKGRKEDKNELKHKLRKITLKKMTKTFS